MPLMKQTDEPAFPDVLWNQPVTRRAAGTLLIIGGHSQQFSQTQEAYQAARGSGAGKVTVVLPRSVGSYTGNIPDVEFMAETPAGSFSRQAENSIRAYMEEASAVLLPGELSRNTETIGLLESLLQGSDSPVIITDEIIRSLLHAPAVLRSASALIAGPQALSELAQKLGLPVYTKTPDLQKEQRLLAGLTEALDNHLVCRSQEHILVSSREQISMTPVKEIDPARLAATAAVFYAQHTQKFEALTTAVWQTKESY